LKEGKYCTSAMQQPNI